ncbi:hypothetical protein CEXT_417021 [Caerostris extrusa]|uniref:Uncharacterized protein n=1 Tax=Caerostris extrusa TaxID=172846 RepID=A0AAV4TAS9_CAEEX|nr:hypothetical protein CEXT_417021 [Caerostris extrusa]
MTLSRPLDEFYTIACPKSKRAVEVACNRIDIFTIFRAPSILQNVNSREFSKRIVEEACVMWPKLKILHGKPTQSQTKKTVLYFTGSIGQDIYGIRYYELEII